MNDIPHIYGTLGPSCADSDILADFLASGMDGIRINLSHGPLSQCGPWLDALRRAEDMTGRKANILIDLMGPELRLGEFPACFIEEGELITLGEGGLPLPAEALRVLLPGMELRVDDGALLWEVVETDGASALVRAINRGALQPRKSVALPAGVAADLPPLTETDLENLQAARTLGIRQVMLPFVHSGEDVRRVRSIWSNISDEPVEIFAKIEDEDGYRALDSILEEADMTVIARGDLGSHVPLTELPVLQAEISRRCRAAGKPFLVVTQMLHSMMHSPVPTRAEVSDIAYAVLSGADAVMLTGETAAGDYPREAMAVMTETVRNIWNYAHPAREKEQTHV